MGLFPKKKNPHKNVIGHVHSFVFPILFAFGSRANTWAEATFLLTHIVYQALSSGVLVF